MGLPQRLRLRAGVSLLLAALSAPAVAGRAADVRVEAFQLMNEGVSAYNRGLYDEAVEKLRRCSDIALNSFRAYYYYGLALSASRRYADAIVALDVALDLEPEDLQALVAHANAYLKLGDVEEARASYARALKIRPAHAPALDGMGRAYEAQADDDQAVEHFRRSILSDKGYAAAYTHLGDLYLRNDRVREAVRLLEEAIAIRPDYAEGHNRLAVAYGRMGMSNEAVASVQKAIELDPRDPLHWQTLGWLQLDQGLLTAAEKSLLHALEIESRLPGARIGLAQIARRRGDYEMALAQIEIASNLPDLDTITADRLRELRPAIEAEELRVAELETRAASGGATPEEYLELSGILARRGLWGEAAESLRQVPATAAHEEWLAYLLFQAGGYREAHGIYDRLAAAGTRRDLELNAAITLALLGSDDAAAERFETILEAEPTHELARLYLANALLRLGRMDGAARNYAAYLETDADNAPAERVRRILRQIAPERIVEPDEPLLPAALPPPPPTDDAQPEIGS